MKNWILNRLPRRSLLVIVFLLCVGDMVDTTLMAISRPSDRLTITLTAAEARVKIAPPDSPIQVDDVLLAVEGHKVDSRELLQPGFWIKCFRERVRDHRRSEPLMMEYTIRRDGHVQTVEVEWKPYTFGEWLQRVWGLFIGSLVLLLVAALVIWERKQEISTRVMAAMLLSLAFVEINNLIPASSVRMLLEMGWFFIPADILAVILVTLLVPLTFFIFPRPMTGLQERRRRWFVFVLFLLLLIIPVMEVALYASGSVLTVREAIFYFLNPVMLLALLSAMVRITYNALRASDPLERTQFRWLALGTAFSLIPFLIFYLIPIFIVHEPLLPLPLANIGILAFPLSILIAIFRYGMIELDQTVSRILSWSILIGAALVVYRPLLRAMRWVWEWLLVSQGHLDLPLITTGVLLFLILLVEPWVQRGMDRLLSQEWRDFDAALGEISEQLTRVMDDRELLLILGHDLPQKLGLQGAFVLLLDEEERRFTYAHTPIQIDAEGPLVKWLQQHGTPVSVYHLRQLPQEVREALLPLADHGVEVVLPIFLNNRIQMLYLLMSRHSANLLTRRELEALTLLEHQLSTTLQNAQLYRQLQDYNRMLEARVRERTRELQAERNRLDAILQNLADGLVVTDLEGGIILTNPAFLRLVGRDERTVLGHPLETIFPLERLPQLRDEVLRQPGEIVAMTLALKEVQRTFKVSACTLKTSDGKGNEAVIGIVIALHDITRERELDRMKTEFLSTVSHELRTPLTAILGFAKLVLRTLERSIEPLIGEEHPREQRALQRAKENLHIIVDEGERLTNLINDLLDISRLESGRMEWHMSAVDMEQVVQRAITAVHALAEDKGLALWVRSDESLPPVKADAQRMMQVIINLLSNAIKFTEEGQIVIRLTRVDLTPEGGRGLEELGRRAPQVPLGSWMLLRVDDTGIGIAEKDLDAIFERFRQAGNVMTDRPQGTGLGLAICREIVQAHGGYIWAESELGKGSSFFVLLPLEGWQEA